MQQSRKGEAGGLPQIHPQIRCLKLWIKLGGSSFCRSARYRSGRWHFAQAGRSRRPRHLLGCTLAVSAAAIRVRLGDVRKRLHRYISQHQLSASVRPSIVREGRGGDDCDGTMSAGAISVTRRVVHMAAGALPAETLALLAGQVGEGVAQAVGYLGRRSRRTPSAPSRRTLCRSQGRSDVTRPK